MSKPLKLFPKTATGIQGLDEILDGGLPQGRPTLLCGTAGSGKTLLAMEFLVRGATLFAEPGVFMAFEETESELVQNMASLGFGLPHLIANEKLLIDFVHIAREEIRETGEYDLEGLFVRLGHAIDSISAKRVVLDTVETLLSGLPNPQLLRAELRRLFRWFKDKGVTAIITGERGEGRLTRHSLEEYVSDCVILLDHRVVEHVSTRHLRVIKYRGSAHGTNEYPFLIDEQGVVVMPITLPDLHDGAFTERVSSSIIQRLDAMLEIKHRRRKLERKRQALEAQILALGEAFSEEEAALMHIIDQEQQQETGLLQAGATLAKSDYTDQNEPETKITTGHLDDQPAKTIQTQQQKPGEIWNLRLYVAGHTPKSLVAFDNLKTICEKHLQGEYTLEVIDLLENPQLARNDQILAIPTLVRKLPLPLRKIIGSLSNTARVLVGLDLEPHDSASKNI